MALKDLIAKLLSLCPHPMPDFSRCAVLSAVDKFQPRGQGHVVTGKQSIVRIRFSTSDVCLCMPVVITLAL